LFRSAKAVAAAALIILEASAGLSSAATYAFDNKHADVSFTYYVGFLSQSGRFTELDGIFQFDSRAPERGSISAVIKTASLTANAWEANSRAAAFSTSQLSQKFALPAILSGPPTKTAPNSAAILP
jgi:polyisoprenoid-binding protein YceI